MLSRNQIKFIASLQQKKFRKLHGLFVAEGPKLAFELLDSEFEVEKLYVLARVLEEQKYNFSNKEVEVVTVSEKDLQRISGMKSPNEMLALVKIPDPSGSIDHLFEDLVLYLDKLQDPGNFGTILRTADWFGIKNIVCSPDTAEVFNPKIVQASMGSVTRVKVFYKEFEKFIGEAPKNFPVYATMLDGQDIYQTNLKSQGVIIIGNESTGISEKLRPFITQKITIPSSAKQTGPESLNASVAAALVMAEFRRQMG